MQHTGGIFEQVFFRLTRREFVISFITIFNRLRFTQSHLPHPKFWFGERVYWEWTNDDSLSSAYGKTYRDYGFVVGMVFQPPQYNCIGWVYWVKWTFLESPATVPLPVIDTAREEDLRIDAED